MKQMTEQEIIKRKIVLKGQLVEITRAEIRILKKQLRELKGGSK